MVLDPKEQGRQENRRLPAVLLLMLYAAVDVLGCCCVGVVVLGISHDSGMQNGVYGPYIAQPLPLRIGMP